MGMEPIVVQSGEPFPDITRIPNVLVYPSTSRGQIAFCNLCFANQRFRDLTVKDVETITWFFGSHYVDERPDYAIELLEPMLKRWRAPDHPYVAIDRPFLEGA
jgi:hypothetical protein